MKKTTRTLLALLALAGLAGCAEVPEAAAPQDTPKIQAPAAKALTVTPVKATPALPSAPLPANVEVAGDGHLFAMETTPELVACTLHGSTAERLAGRLADEEGRRTIVHYPKDGRAPHVIFAADWLLPAVGAVNRQGEMLVCVNRLVGQPSALTQGNVPDPSQGVDLACRWRSGRGWSREYKLPRAGAALWLSDVVAQRDGSFRIVYANDLSGLLVDDATRDEGIYRVRFHRGRLGKPVMASRFPQP